MPKRCKSTLDHQYSVFLSCMQSALDQSILSLSIMRAERTGQQRMEWVVSSQQYPVHLHRFPTSPQCIVLDTSSDTFIIHFLRIPHPTCLPPLLPYALITLLTCLPPLLTTSLPLATLSFILVPPSPPLPMPVLPRESMIRN